MIKNTDEDIWEWYQHIENWKKSGLPQKKFAESVGISYNKMTNMIFRIIYKATSDPKTYAKLVKFGRSYLESGSKFSSQYAKDNGIMPSHLSEIITHLNYLDIIERMKKEKESQMNFIQVPTMNLPMLTPQEPQIMEKQNDLEIIISKGVRVSISSNIETMKVVKIIELLKDL